MRTDMQDGRRLPSWHVPNDILWHADAAALLWQCEGHFAHCLTIVKSDVTWLTGTYTAFPIPACHMSHASKQARKAEHNAKRVRLFWQQS